MSPEAMPVTSVAPLRKSTGSDSMPYLAKNPWSRAIHSGMSRGVVEWVNRGAPVPKRTRRFYLAGVTIHGTHNIVVTILYIAGVFSF